MITQVHVDDDRSPFSTVHTLAKSFGMVWIEETTGDTDVRGNSQAYVLFNRKHLQSPRANWIILGREGR
jgi:hypothetical protein